MFSRHSHVGFNASKYVSPCKQDRVSSSRNNTAAMLPIELVVVPQVWEPSGWSFVSKTNLNKIYFHIPKQQCCAGVDRLNQARCKRMCVITGGVGGLGGVRGVYGTAQRDRHQREFKQSNLEFSSPCWRSTRSRFNSFWL